MLDRTSRSISGKLSALYLCQFSQGTIKIGIGVDVEARLTSHKAAGAVFGIAVARTDVVPCDHLKRAEKLLIEWCMKNSTGRTGREWFSGLDYEECLRAARAAAAAMIGPHPYQPPKPDMLDLVLHGFKPPLTKEAAFYSEARAKMREQVAGGVLAAFDYLHQQSELVRARISPESPAPKWFDTLNSFEPWEIELWFDHGSPSAELLRAGAEAIYSISRSSSVAEADHG